MDIYETFALGIDPSGDLPISFEDAFFPLNSSDLDGIPVDSERFSGGDSYSYCVIA
jgi:hypothetical protein